MPLMGETLGQFLRRRRRPIGWNRMQQATGLEARAMRNYELGRMPPLDVGLKIGEALGVPLDELAEVVLGRPYKTAPPTVSPGVLNDAKAGEPVALDAHRARRERRGQSGRRPAKSRTSPSQGEEAPP